MDNLIDFHFLRPLWLLVLLPLTWLLYRFWRKRLESTGLEAWIDARLLPFLTSGANQRPSSLPVIGLGLLWLFAVIALAGPTWERREQPVYESQSALVIALDLSPSMSAEDIKPSRIIRAHFKIQDLLNARKDGLTALIVYAGEAFVVTPLTDDTRTISNLLPTLTPGILPIPGSNVEMAVEVASDLVSAAAINKASLLLMTDGIDKAAFDHLQEKLPGHMDLNILGIGTEAGAPIPDRDDFLKDGQGNIIVARRNGSEMQSLAQNLGGHYLPLQADSSDIDFFVDYLEKRFSTDNRRDSDNRTSDAWHELGPTLVLMMLPLLALCFRRGWLLTLMLSGLLGSYMMPTKVYAEAAPSSWWQHLWKNSDQRGFDAWRQQDYGQATREFEDSRWLGSAHYKQGNYDDAIEAFARDKTAVGDYNRGNALARQQQFDEAISAYEQALKKDPGLEAARINKDILEQLKKQQEQQQQNSQSDQQKTDNNQQPDSQQQNAEQNQSHRQDSQQQNTQKNQQEASEQNNQQTSEREQSNQNDEQQEAQKAEESQQKGEAEEQQTLAQYDQQLSPEQQQALEQWLRKVPDDPSGLLKRKFQYEFDKRKNSINRDNSNCQKIMPTNVINATT